MVKRGKGRHSIVTEYLLQQFEQTIPTERRLTIILTLRQAFTFSRTTPYGMVTIKLGFVNTVHGRCQSS